MKQKIIIFFLSLGSLIWAQNTITAPLPEEAQFETDNFEAFTNYADQYWLNTPHDYKGSGIKPYMRWKALWGNRVKPDGTLMTGAEIRESYNAMRLLVNETQDNNSNWVPLGPTTNTVIGGTSGQGRVNVIVVDPSNPNTIYIGAPNGGIWKSTDHGSTWASIGDLIPVLGVSGIAVDYNNPNIIYVSTGDEDAGDSAADGVYKTTDGGASWTKVGNNLTASRMGEIYISPTDSNRLWVVSNGGAYLSTDAGATWTQKISGTCKEIRLKPGDPNTVYVLRDAGASNEIHKSTDGGNTFSVAHTFTGIGGRAVMDVTPANSAYLYVLLSNADNTYNSVWRSTDSGTTFSMVNNTNDVNESSQAWFDYAIGVSDTNADTFYTGCLDLWRSTNGGTLITQQNFWFQQTSRYTHGDIHYIKYYNGKIYVGSDGGIYISEDNGNTFQDKTIGLNISQFYRLDVAQNNLSRIAGGLQDNGGFAYNSNAWVKYHGGDGMDAAINPAGDQAYGFTQYGNNLTRLNYNSNTAQNIATDTDGNNTGEWITPLEHGNGGTLYSGNSVLNKLGTGGWTSASMQTFSPDLKAIRVADNNDKLVLVSQGTKLYKSDGTSDPLVFAETGYPFTVPFPRWGANITNFDFNRNNSDIIYVTTRSSVFKSTDGGATWSNITGSVPTADPKVGIIHQKNSVNNTVYLATENAVYYINDALTDWQIFNTGMPNTTITDIEVNNVENSVLVSTYGRGIYRTEVDTESLAVEDIHNLENTIYIYPNPVKGIAHINMDINEKANLSVYNSAGAVVLQKEYNSINQSTDLDFSSLVPGIYFVKILSDTHLIYKKIVKN